MKFGVVMFPGSNCDHDTYHVISKVIGQPVDFIWHRQNSVCDCDAMIMPGGFSYGDYLRTGAIARFSPVMGAVKEFASRGGLVMGICNGFQILCEAGLLARRAASKQESQVHLRTREHARRSTDTPFTNAASAARCCRFRSLTATETISVMPRRSPSCIARTESSSVTRMRRNLTADANPNGSLDNIAGICNRERNVLGMMPHPERASEHCWAATTGGLSFILWPTRLRN